MGKRLHRQAGQLHEVFAELVRRYQFRDRDSIVCHGISVSQCYSLDALWRSGSLTMGELAAELALEISTMTRIVDHLVEVGLADRQEDPADRRVRRADLRPTNLPQTLSLADHVLQSHRHQLVSFQTKIYPSK